MGHRKLLAGALLLASVVGCQASSRWHATDVTGVFPPLEMTLTRVSDGQLVTAGDYRGKVVMLYFGFSHCKNVCPITLANVERVFQELGPAARSVRMLFVTVDPERDTPAVLAKYVHEFGPGIVGLRADPDQLTRLVRRYRAAYSVTPQGPDRPYLVTHSSAIYVFDQTGAARLLVSSLSSGQPDVSGVVDDLKRLVRSERPRGFFASMWERI